METADTPVHPPAEQGADNPSGPALTARRRRQPIEAAVAAPEITTAVVAQSRAATDYARTVIARPHILVAATAADTTGQPRIVVCEGCRRNIDTPGIAIVRGRTIMHVRCDWQATG